METRRLLLAVPLLLLLALPALADTKPDSPPRPIKMVPPVYTQAMRATPVYGEVIIEFDVDTNGLVSGAKVVKSLSPDADQAALESVQKSLFEPAFKDGQPVPVHTRMPIRFISPPSGVASRFDTPPRPVKQVPPVATSAMRRSLLKGAVTVDFIVDESGKVTDAKVVKPLTPDADRAALDCVRKWQFKPATKDGQPVKAQLSQLIQFNFN